MIKVENNRGAEGNESINKIGIGLSIAAVASVSVAVIASEKIIKKVSHVSNRYKVKSL